MNITHPLAAAAADRVSPVAGLVPQRCLEDWGISGATSDRDGVGPDATVRRASFVRLYTPWQNRDDRSDPVNLAALSPEPQAAVDRELPPDLPKWIVRQRDRMRYLTPWEAVHTQRFNPAIDADVGRNHGSLLRSHLGHVLHNQFRAQYARNPSSKTQGRAELVSLAAVRPVDVVVDGALRPGVIDTNAFAYRAGVRLSDGRVLTAAIARNVLRLLGLKLVSDVGLSGTPPSPAAIAAPPSDLRGVGGRRP